MNALTPQMEALLLASSAVSLGTLTMAMSSNIGRDVKIRGSEFRTFEAALFEYVVNAYEAYDLDQLPVVTVTVKGNKAVIEDNGVGMDLEILKRYWTMHAGTVRRKNGRNRRGYYGSGKSAFYKVAHEIVVETVRDGVLNSMSMTSAEVDLAAAENRAPAIRPVAAQQYTGRANGTKITLHLREKPTAAEMRALHVKVAENLRYVMNGAVVTINGQTVEPRPVHGAQSTQESICGNFSAVFTYNDGGHAEDDSKVFYKVGGCYIAAEQTGKEGHRFSHRVMVEIDTTEAWALEHFENRREHFMSEARDLRLNDKDPCAKELRDFAEHVVRGFMKKLEDEEAQRRKEELSEARKRLIEQMSRVMGAVMTLGGQMPRTKKDAVVEVKEVTEREIQQRNGRGSNGDRSPKVKFSFDAFENLSYQYELQPDCSTVIFNTNSPAIKAVIQDDRDPMKQQVLWSIAAEAIAELETARHVNKQAEQGVALTLEEALKYRKDFVTAVHDRLADIYRGCQA